MELVNPNTSYTWSDSLDIHGIPMKGHLGKQWIEFNRHGWLAAKENPTINADDYGAMIRKTLRPLSLKTLNSAREEYKNKNVIRAPRYWIAEIVGGICARRCPFCSINVMRRPDKDGKEAKAGMIAWEAWTKFVNECGEYSPYGLSAYQLGEPMNYIGHDINGNKKDIGDIIDTAKSVGKFKIVNVSTHADVPNLDRLLECDVDDLIVSLDAITPETYAKNRPATNGKQEGAFERTVDRFKNFLAKKSERGYSKPYVIAQIINSSLTKDEVLPFIREWITVDGIDSVAVKFLDSMRPWIGDKMVSDEEDSIKARGAGQLPCQHLWSIGSITHTGVFNACAHDAFTQLTDGSSIYTSSIFDFWNGNFMNELRADHLGGAKRLPCVDCRDRDVWTG